MKFYHALVLLLCTASACFAEEPTAIVNSIGMRLIPIAAGTFDRGSPPSEPGRRDRETQAKVELSPFYLGQFEVTQAQYARVMDAHPSEFAAAGSRSQKVEGIDTADFPVDSVTWPKAVEFCERLSALPDERAVGRRYRLPTEAEWEYACRAGTTGPFAFGDDASKLGDHAWIASNAEDRPHAVGQKLPNGWGLYDLYGNVWEWCSDGYDDSYGSSAEASSLQHSRRDPQGSSDATLRVIRGGGYASSIPARMRSAARNFDPPEIGDADTGFRVAMEVVRDAD